MKLGHILALIGAILVAVGAAVLPWQSFQLADIVALGYEVRPAGQIILGLAALIALTSVLGVVTRKRYQFATATLIVSIFLIAWIVVAHVTRASEFELQPFEIVEMLGGYTLAVWGAFLTFFGALVVLASEPAMDPDAEFLRVALLWNGTVIQEKLLQEPQTFTIGEGLRNDFVIPNEQLPKKFPLFRAGRKGHYDIGLSTDLEGEITVNRETQPISEFVKKGTENKSGVNFVPVAAGDWGMVHLDELQVFFQFVKPEAKVARRGFLAFDANVTAAVAVSFLLQAGFLIWTVLSWQETAIRVKRESAKKPLNIEVVTILQKIEEPLEENEDDDSTAKKAEDEEGKFGDPEEDPEKDSKVPKNEGKMVKEIDPKKVGLTDLLSSDKLMSKSALADIFSQNDAFQNKIAVAMAGTGTEFVMGFGAGGLGFAGTGRGGGGTGGYGRIHGMGKIDTGGGMGVKAGLGKKRAKRVGKINVGSGQAQGFCKKSHIASVVRRRAGAIRACYEKRLQVKPKLQGKLSVRWTISLDGSVQSAGVTQNSLGDAEVTNCVLRVLRRMRFNKPEGGICIVQWPFVFSGG